MWVAVRVTRVRVMRVTLVRVMRVPLVRVRVGVRVRIHPYAASTGVGRHGRDETFGERRGDE